MSVWSDLKDKVVAIGADVTTLDVVTLTGEITVDSAVENKKISLKKLYGEVESQTAVKGKLDVVAFTHIDLDADAINFVNKDLTEEKKALVAAHNESVRAAQETRAGIVSMVRAFFQ